MVIRLWVRTRRRPVVGSLRWRQEEVADGIQGAAGEDR